MKKKFSLWLNIATICLCICAIAIGVYAAQQATLKVSGTIGFTAHNINYTATAVVKNYLTDPDIESSFVSESTPITIDQSDTEITLPTGTNNGIYFSDFNGIVKDMVIELSITNESDFPIEVKSLTLPTNSTIQSRIEFDVQNGLAQMGDKNADTDVKTQKIIITMSLLGENDLSLIGLSFNLVLNKYQKIKYDETNNYYYTTMGSHVVIENGEQKVKAVRWLPIAKGVATDSTTTFSQFDYKTTEPQSGYQYYFVSEKILDIDNNIGISYNNSYSNGYDTNYTNLSAHNYLSSNIRRLLKNESVYCKAKETETNVYEPDGDFVNLFDEYGISGYVYENIIARPTEKLYANDSAGNTYANISAELKGDDRLWLLSLAEATDYLGSSKMITTTFCNGVSSTWWTRTPYAYSDLSILEGLSGYSSSALVNAQSGIRPAFMIEI